MTMNKKASHVGFVLSFVIFIAFLVFVFEILEPALNAKFIKKEAFNVIESIIIKDITSEITTLTIKIDDEKGLSNGKDCIKFDGLHDFIVGNLTVKDFSNNGLKYYQQEQFYVEKINKSNRFFKIYRSNDFISNQEGMGGCDLISEGDYVRGLMRDESYVVQTKFQNILYRYDSDYENLREEINVPLAYEFGIFLVLENGTSIGRGTTTTSKSIYVEETPVKYMDENINITLGHLVIAVW